MRTGVAATPKIRPMDALAAAVAQSHAPELELRCDGTISPLAPRT